MVNESDFSLKDPRWAGRHHYYLWALLARTRDAVYKVRQRELSGKKLTTEQSAVLNIVRGLECQDLSHRATPAEISRRLFRESQSVSELLHRMSQDGLVRKVKDLDRRNMVRIELTKKGRDLLDASMAGDGIRRIMSRLSSTQRRQLTSLLKVVRQAALDELGAKSDEEIPPFSVNNGKRFTKTPAKKSAVSE